MAEGALAGGATASRWIESVRRPYERTAVIVIFAVMPVWHMGDTLPLVLSGWRIYRPAYVGLAVWAEFFVVGCALSVIVLRGGGQGPALGLGVSPLLLAGAVAVALATPSRTPMDAYAWAFPCAPWLAMLAFWRRPMRELAGFCAAHALTGLAVCLTSDRLTATNLAYLISLSYGSYVMEFAVMSGCRQLATLGIRTAQVQRDLAILADRQTVAAALHQDRLNRFDLVRRVAAELLRGLASGDLDPTDESAQVRLRVAVARLRRLIVETDDVDDPLRHELIACADIAERRGVVIDLPPSVGRVPPLSTATRRALTEPLIEFIATARTRARITVVAEPGSVAVAVVSDAAVTATGAAVTAPGTDFSHLREGDLSWAQTQWTAASLSPSWRISTS